MKPRLLLPALAAALVLSASQPASAEVKLSALFSDHMVLQSGKTVPVWGWAAPDEEVTVTIAGQTKSAKAGAYGKWTIKLDALKPSDTPTTLIAKGTNTLTVQDVLIGEVWLGSGQSNMAMNVTRARDFEKEKAAATLPQIRMFTVGGNAVEKPQDTVIGSWVVCSPETVGGFSATAYFFGREIHQKLNVPVGLINSSVGGTPIDAWISPEAQHDSQELKPLLAELEKAKASLAGPGAPVPGTSALAPAAGDPKAAYQKQLAAWAAAVKKARVAGQPIPRRPQDPTAVQAKKNNVGGLFNGKIAALIPYGLRGILWYQGEANSTPIKAPYYQYHLPLLVQDWRARWGEELPFAWVQLPNFANRGDGWCLVREAMLKTLKLPKTGMAITLDIGEAQNIHPQNKQEVGKRLAAWALGTVYKTKGVIDTSGPLPAGHEVKDGSIILSFTHADGLNAKGGELKEFVIAGEDKQWHPAQAKIEGSKVIVSSDAVPKPVAVRYAWKDNPEATLFNAAGIPATQFRTDDWPIVLVDAQAERQKLQAERAAKARAAKAAKANSVESAATPEAEKKGGSAPAAAPKP